MRFLGILILLLSLTACSKTQLTQLDFDAMGQQSEAKKACYEARELDLTKVPDEAIGYAVIAKQNSDLILAVLGKDPCATTNAFDVQIAEVTSKNKVISAGLDSAATLGMFYIGGEVIKKALSGMNSYHVEGQFNEMSTTHEVNSRNTATSQKDSGNTFTTSPIDSNVSNVD